ncbi:WD domain-containing protein [Aphelenchoides avenae]|nr:WD domain-containing protein [Aphelenchus avenae]
MPTRRSRQDSVGSLGPGPSKKSHVSSANKENNPSDSSLSPEDRRARRAETSALVARVVQMSKEKHMKACASKKSVHAVKPPFVHATTVFEGHKKQVYAVAFNPYSEGDTMYFCTAGSNKASTYACTVGGSDVKLLRVYHDPDHTESLYAVTWAYSKDSEQVVVVVGGMRGVIRVIAPHSGKMLTNLQGHGDAINELRTCPSDSMIVASASKDFTVRLWHIRHSQCIAILGGVDGHRDQVLSLDFVENHYLASASMDHGVKLWHIGCPEVEQRIQEAYDNQLDKKAVELHYPVAGSRDLHTNYVDCVRCMGKLIFSKSSENKIVMWKFGRFGEGVSGIGTVTKPDTLSVLMAELTLPAAATWFVKFDLDPTNQYFCCGNEKGDIHMWSLRNGIPKKESDFVLPAKDYAVCLRHVVFSPDGRTMIAVGDQGRVSRYNFVDGAGPSSAHASKSPYKASK